MTELVKLHIPGQPQGKGRARSARLPNGQTIHYTPAKTRTYEGMIRTQAISAVGDQNPTESPVMLTLLCGYQIPKSWPRWKRDMALAGQIVPTVKPDTDNVLKAVKDALNSVVWRDDCQVVSTIKDKIYTDNPFVSIEVATVDAHPAQITRRPANA